MLDITKLIRQPLYAYFINIIIFYSIHFEKGSKQSENVHGRRYLSFTLYDHPLLGKKRPRN